MIKTFYVGEHNKHKIDVYFGLFGKEKIYVDGIIVHDKMDLSLKGKKEFKAGDHNILIDTAVNLRNWSHKVFVDGSLYIDELFQDELLRHKNRSRKFYKYLLVACIIVLLFSFLKGFYHGLVG